MPATCSCAAAGTAWVSRGAAAPRAVRPLPLPPCCGIAAGGWDGPPMRAALNWYLRLLPAANALDKIVMELTLLGFVSLILTAFSSPISHICGEPAPTCRRLQGATSPGFPHSQAAAAPCHQPWPAAPLAASRSRGTTGCTAAVGGQQGMQAFMRPATPLPAHPAGLPAPLPAACPSGLHLGIGWVDDGV